MTESCHFPTISNFCIPHSLWFHPFFSHSICVIHEQSVSTLSDICETHLEKKQKTAEMESVLKMCERFGPFIKEARSFFHVLPHGVLSPYTFFFLFSFIFSPLCSFDIQHSKMYCMTVLYYKSANNQNQTKKSSYSCGL